jgi:hypothetical protein
VEGKITMTMKNNNLLLSFSLGSGYNNKEFRKKYVPIRIGISELEKDLNEKYGIRLVDLLSENKKDRKVRQ